VCVWQLTSELGAEGDLIGIVSVWVVAWTRLICSRLQGSVLEQVMESYIAAIIQGSMSRYSCSAATPSIYVPSHHGHIDKFEQGWQCAVRHASPSPSNICYPFLLISSRH